MYNPWESFNEDDENYEAINDDIDFDEKLLRKFESHPPDLVKNIISKMYKSLDSQDWYKSFAKLRDKDPNAQPEFLEFSDEVLYEFARDCVSQEELNTFLGFIKDDDEMVELYKLLDVFGFFNKQLKYIETIDDMFEDLDG